MLQRRHFEDLRDRVQPNHAWRPVLGQAILLLVSGGEDSPPSAQQLVLAWLVCLALLKRDWHP